MFHSEGNRKGNVFSDHSSSLKKKKKKVETVSILYFVIAT